MGLASDFLLWRQGLLYHLYLLSMSYCTCRCALILYSFTFTVNNHHGVHYKFQGSNGKLRTTIKIRGISKLLRLIHFSKFYRKLRQLLHLRAVVSEFSCIMIERRCIDFDCPLTKQASSSRRQMRSDGSSVDFSFTSSFHSLSICGKKE